jgi:excisionase family DNA binding protein
MRTAPQLAADYKAADPDTPINPHFLRGLINSGKIPYVKAGKRFLISAAAVEEYLSNGEVAEQPEQHDKIRRIS